MNSPQKYFSTILLCTGLLTLPIKAFALIPVSGSGTWGSFEGTFSYIALDESLATLMVELTNTSDEANGGYITAFVFNNVGAAIESASLSLAPVGFELLGDPDYDDSVNGAPNGQFDIGAGLGASFEGGGNPTGGIGVNQVGSFIFMLNGSGMNLISEMDFFQEFSVPPGIGEGPEAFVVRFRGFNNGQSDKVPGGVVPEPGTVLLIGSGLAAAAIIKRRKK